MLLIRFYRWYKSRKRQLELLAAAQCVCLVHGGGDCLVWLQRVPSYGSVLN